MVVGTPASSATAAAIGRDRIRGLDLIAFRSLGMPIAAAEVPLTTYLPPLYASSLGFSLASLGLIFLVTRLFDAVIDPLVGALSDRTRTRFGRRKPWIAAGAAIFAMGAIPLFFPPAGFGPAGLALTLFVFYVGYSLIAIPFSAWAGELSSRYHERTRVTTYVTVMTALALLLALVLPALLDAIPALLAAHPIRPGGFSLIPQALRDPAVLKAPRVRLAAMGLMVFILLGPAVLLGLRALPEPPSPPRPKERLRLGASLRLLAGERLLLRVLASNFAVRLGQGIRTALFVFFIARFMGRPQWAPALFLLQYVFGIAAGPIWLAVGRRIGKHNAAVAGELAQVAINLGLLLLAPSRFGLLLGLTVAQGLAQGSGNLMLRAIVADVADHHRLRSDADNTGLFFSVFSLSDKAALAASVGIALPLVALFGFNPRGANTPDALFALKAVFALGPALAHSLSAALIFGFPIDEARHAGIRAELDARAAAPPGGQPAPEPKPAFEPSLRPSEA